VRSQAVQFKMCLTESITISIFILAVSIPCSTETVRDPTELLLGPDMYFSENVEKAVN
jgi:hypothetical protein